MKKGCDNIKFNMKNFTFLSIILMIFVLIASVSAANIDEDAVISTIDDESVDIENNLKNDQIVEKTDDQNQLSASTDNDKEILSNNSGTWSDLSSEIGAGGDKILTKKNYTFDNRTTINITIAGVIDGNGAVIDMGGINIRAFKVTVNGVTFKNLCIKNGYYDGPGCAIYFDCNSSSVKNCNFINNTAYDGEGGAIYFAGSGIVDNCNFSYHEANYDKGKGGAVYFNDYGKLTNCNFTENSARNYGGAAYFNAAGDVINCSFTGNGVNNDMDDAGGALYLKEGNVINCDFINNDALTGGAIYITNGNITNCNFNKNKARSSGGAIYFDGYINVSNCNFTKNKAESNGGAIEYDQYSSTVVGFDLKNCIFNGNEGENGGAVDGDGNVVSCSFINNTADGNGGGINFISNGIVVNCNFTGNEAEKGGAIYIATTGNVSNCMFTSNTASNNGGAIYMENTGNIITSTFIANNAADGGAIYICDSSNVLNNCNFINNTASSGGGAVSTVGAVVNCNFTNNKASGRGGAIHFTNSGNVSNCNFIENTGGDGGAVQFENTDGDVENCSFIKNTATQSGAAISFYKKGYVRNSNFTSNEASIHGGAIYLPETGIIDRCNFEYNKAEQNGGALYGKETCNITNSNFTANKGVSVVVLDTYSLVDNCTFFNNSALNSFDYELAGAVYFKDTGKVTNCNFVINDGYSNLAGAAIVLFNGGSVDKCNFTHNIAHYGSGGAAISTQGYVEISNSNFVNNTSETTGGAIHIGGIYGSVFTCIVTNCSFINNTATYNGGAITMQDGDVINCIFINNAAEKGGAIYHNRDEVADDKGKIKVDSCVFKTDSDTIYDDDEDDVSIKAPKLSVDNFTSYYHSGEKVTFDFKTNDDMVISNGVIYISVYYENDTLYGEYSCISGEGWTVDLPAGSFYAVYDTDYKKFKSVNATLSITKANSTIEIDDIVYEYCESHNVTVKTEGATGITATINGTNVTVYNNFIIELPDLDVGNYTLTITTIPDSNHYSTNKTVNITVNKALAKIILTNNIMSLIIGDVVPIGASLTPEEAGELVYTSSNSSVIRVENGTIIAVGQGKATVTVSLTDNLDYGASNKTILIIVSLIPTQLSANAITTTYNVNKNLVITLKDKYGAALSGVVITVNLNGVKKYTTNSKGQITISTKSLGAKKYTAKITFNGIGNYSSSAKNVVVTVKKATPKITAKSKSFKVKTKTKKYAIVLKNNLNKVMKKVKVTLKVKGKTYSAKTNSKGKAIFKITKLKKKGRFKAIITYKGNSNYNKVTKKVTIKVK